ncbi:MAG TPA: CoA-binding protein [Tepidisphaeraceae bacterium]|jgi:predicted CoA-binding protein|nr:CoA-binding protein [Tepidisphaeraceae bacterium]
MPYDPEDACPLPTPPPTGQTDPIERMLSARRLAIVGLSDDPARTSNQVGAYLQAAGYKIIPINPNCKTALGEPSLISLAELREPPDLVLVFRRSEYTPQIAEEAAAAHAKGLWLQTGIRNPHARRTAENSGMDYIEDRCMMVEHIRHKRANR